MNARTTLILILLAGMLVGSVYWIEQNLPSTRQRAMMQRGPLGMAVADLRSLQVSAQDNEVLRLEALDGQWWVAHPYRDLAQPERLRQLLGHIEGMGWLQRLERSEFADEQLWQRTSLDRPALWLQLSDAAGVKLRLGLGTPAPLDGCHYLRLERAGVTSYHVVKTSLPEALKLQASQWRDDKALRTAVDGMLSLVLERPAGKIELHRLSAQKSAWEMVSPLRSRVGKEAMSDLLATLLNLSVDEVLASSAQAAGNSPAADVLKVEMRIAAQKQPWVMTLSRPGNSGGKAVATCSWRSLSFQVSSKSLDLLWSEPNALRDKRLCQVDADQLNSLRIESVDHPAVELQKRNDVWYINRHGSQSAANGGRVADLFAALNDYHVQEFVSDSPASLAPFGLQQPLVRLCWGQEGQQKPQCLEIGVGASEGFFAKYADAPSVFRVDASLLPAIAHDAIKWKSLALLRFSTFAVRKISLGAGEAPAVILEYSPTTAQWRAQRAGRDITALLDRVKADRLAGLLANLNVQDWAADGSAAVAALKAPALRIEIELGEPGNDNPADRRLLLEFSPSQAGNMNSALFFGRLSGKPDLFYLSRSTLVSLLTPVLRDR